MIIIAKWFNAKSWICQIKSQETKRNFMCIIANKVTCYKESNNKHNLVTTISGDDLSNIILLFKASLRYCGDIISTQMFKQTDVRNSQNKETKSQRLQELVTQP